MVVMFCIWILQVDLDLNESLEIQKELEIEMNLLGKNHCIKNYKYIRTNQIN